MKREFTAFESKTFKLDIVRYGDGELEVKTSGLLSPFLGGLESKLGNYLWGLNSKVIDGKLVISTGFPPIPSNGFEKLVKTEIKRFIGIHRPQNITIMVTGSCQCSCRHCLVGDMVNKDTPQLSKRYIKKAIDQSIDLGASQVLFEGGEPSLRDDLPELVRYVGDRASTMVVTNGIEMDRELVADLGDSGLDYLNFSLDSPYPEKHNEFRQNENAFDGVINGLEAAYEHDLVSAVLYVATPSNTDRETLIDLIQLCSSKNVFELMIEEVVDTGNWNNKETITDDIKKEIEDLQRECVDKGNRLITRFYKLREQDCFGCFAGKRWMYMSPEGSVMPCMHTPINFGNIKNQDLHQIWRKMRRHPLYRKERDKCVHETDRYRESLREISENQSPPYPKEKFRR